MELVIEGNERLLNIRIIGPLVAATCSTLRETVREISTSGRNHIQLDLAEMPVIDTAGVGALVSIKVTLAKRGGSLHVFNAQPKVQSILSMLKLDQALGGH